MGDHKEHALRVIVALGSCNNPYGALSPIAQSRLDKAITQFYEYPGAKIIVTGGKGPFNEGNRSHAYYQKQYLIKQGIPNDDILLANQSTNTVEDALLCKGLIEEHQFTNVVIVTSNFHIERASLIFSCFMPPGQLTCIGCRNTLSEKELARQLEHETEAVQQIIKQGGIIVEDEVFKMPKSA